MSVASDTQEEVLGKQKIVDFNTDSVRCVAVVFLEVMLAAGILNTRPATLETSLGDQVRA